MAITTHRSQCIAFASEGNPRSHPPLQARKKGVTPSRIEAAWSTEITLVHRVPETTSPADTIQQRQALALPSSLRQPDLLNPSHRGGFVTPIRLRPLRWRREALAAQIRPIPSRILDVLEQSLLRKRWSFELHRLTAQRRLHFPNRDLTRVCHAPCQATPGSRWRYGCSRSYPR